MRTKTENKSAVKLQRSLWVVIGWTKPFVKKKSRKKTPLLGNSVCANGGVGSCSIADNQGYTSLCRNYRSVGVDD